jgi:hypothetical protein
MFTLRTYTVGRTLLRLITTTERASVACFLHEILQRASMVRDTQWSPLGLEYRKQYFTRL